MSARVNDTTTRVDTGPPLAFRSVSTPRDAPEPVTSADFFSDSAWLQQVGEAEDAPLLLRLCGLLIGLSLVLGLGRGPARQARRAGGDGRDLRDRFGRVGDVRLESIRQQRGRVQVLALHLALELVEPFLHLRVRCEQPLLLGRRLVAVGESLQERVEARRRIADLVGEHHAEAIGFELFIPPESGHHQLGGLVDQPVEEGRVPLERFIANGLDALALLDGLHGVFLGHVNQLVGEHARQLGFVRHQRQRSARDVDEAPGRRKSVDAVGVEHDEGVRQVRPGARLRQQRSDQAHVAVDLLILNHPVSQTHFFAHGCAQSDLVILGDDEVTDLLGALQQGSELPRFGWPRLEVHCRGEGHHHPARDDDMLWLHGCPVFQSRESRVSGIHRLGPPHLVDGDLFRLALHDHAAKGLNIISPFQADPRLVADDDVRRILLVE